jgi:hypothetical protein
MVMSGHCIVNPRDQSKFQYVGYPFTGHISIDSHLESSHNDFNFKETNYMHVFDSYDITQVPTSFYNLEFLTQVDVSYNIDYTIGADTCKTETLANKSLVFVDILVNSNVFSFHISTNLSQHGQHITFPFMIPFEQFHNHFHDKIES